ncbi:hypothetical protein BDZ45DRAFT_804580 [Acephala macrosclerotiorum]|nr:hypothetical protein BDZ45DRAFT_804580 [Acephala macrosclerotiorum]
MIKQEVKVNGERGFIVNMSSIMGLVAGVNQYTQTAMNAETTTHMTPLEVLIKLHPLNGVGMPNDITKMALVLASDDASWVTGACIPVDGGYTAQ